MALGRHVVCGLALTAGALVAQGQPRAALPPPANVITLNVIARDARNQAVTDLSVDDFQVTDQGKPQKITFFHRYEDGRQLSAPLGPREYSNRSGAAPHALAILFDLLNADFSYRGYGAEEIVRSLEHLESSDLVYLYLLTSAGKLYPIRAAPDADSAAPPANSAWVQQIKPMLDSALKEVSGFKPIDEQITPKRIEATYQAFQTLAMSMAPLPGHKDILWISQGTPLVIPQPGRTSFDFTPRMQRLTTLVERAGISINTVEQGNALATGSRETLDDFPNLTGGKAYPQRSVEKAVPEILASSRSSYLIEYAAPQPDGKFHKVRVTAAKKGVHLQAPDGYSTAPDAATAQVNANAALTSPYDESAIGICASTSAGANGLVHLEARVDSRDLFLQPKGDGFTIPLTILFEAFTAKGPEASATTATISLTRAQKDKPSKNDISISQDLDASIERIRVVVIDNGTNQIGSLTVPISAK